MRSLRIATLYHITRFTSQRKIAPFGGPAFHVWYNVIGIKLSKACWTGEHLIAVWTYVSATALVEIPAEI